MKDKLDKLMSRAFGKPMYRLAMIILGFPTILVAFLAFLMNRGKESAEYTADMDSVRKSAEEDGTLERIRKDARYYLTSKYQHFGKSTDNSQFQKELEKQIDELLK